MNSRPGLPAAAVLAGALCLGLGVGPACADFTRGPAADAGTTAPDGGGGGDGGVVSFAADVHPLLIADCQSCHRSGGAAGDTSFVLTGEVEADYASATSSIDVSSPSASRLLRKAAGVGHGGGAIYGDGTPEYQTLLAWIAGGAQP